MKKLKKMVALLGAMSLVGSLGVGCGKSSTAAGAQATDANGIKEFTFYIAMPGTEIPEDNRLYNEIAKRIGAKAKMSFLTGQTAKESIGTMVAGGDYTDLIVGSDGTSLLMDAGALVPVDEYWDNYPNIKNFIPESEWNKLRAEDGHIYLIPEFGIINDHDMQTYHNDEAFWIQVRVLEWAGWPKLNTLDEYFDLIERYVAENPKMDDGLENIGYEILSDDWRYYCLENPPLFLDGYPNDGCCFVDPETLTAHNYNTTDTAKAYFKKLNEEYQKGIIDPETFTLNYDQYIAKLSTGRVCGMVDQYWNFQDAEKALITQGLDDCTYVPVGAVLKDGTIERYHSAPAFDVSNGLSVTTSCKDVEGAFKMINDLLDPEIQTLRYWGMEGVDYEVGEGGVFYRTDEQRKNALDKNFQVNELILQYANFPHHEGMSLDGINAYTPDQQPDEYYDSQTPAKKKVLDAYGIKTFTQFLNESQENEPWYPMWSYTNTWTADTAYGIAKVNMDEVKHEWLPKVVMDSNFDSAWEQYMKVFDERVDVKAYEDALTEEVKRRVAVAEGKEGN